MGGYKINALENLSCLAVKNVLSFKHQRKTVRWLTILKTYGVISYDSGWRKDVINQRLESG